jgi:hypothetical protein
MRRACSAHERNEKYLQNFGWKNMKRSDHSEGLGVDGKLILEGILGK